MNNIQKATWCMTPAQIAAWWATVCRDKGASCLTALTLSDVLDWRHPDAQRLRDEAISELPPD
jgi:nitrous oxide reductase accessory protein NosL